MEKVANQLKKLLTINRKIINQLNKDEANIALLQQRFTERGSQAKRLTKLTAQVDSSMLTEGNKKSLRRLFKRFDRQQTEIQQALDYILKESKDRLGNAIKQNKAEQSYRVLNR